LSAGIFAGFCEKKLDTLYSQAYIAFFLSILAFEGS
jgi:hypothetical protein